MRSVPRRRVWWAALVGGVGLAAAPVFTSVAGAQPVSQTFSFTGSAQTFTVPENVCQITIDALGAEGGDVSTDRPGGLGGEAESTVAVTPGEVLQVLVGGQGGTSATAAGGAGGFNGGADGGSGINASGGGGGGGATDVRSAPYGEGQRLVVAGGGGGAGNAEPVATPAGGDGGGVQGDPGASSDPVTSPNAGGGGATQSAAGAGGTIADGVNGAPGSGSSGGAGASVATTDVSPGGGGGGGWFGGGGGAGGDPKGGNGGGGGGSGFTSDGNGLTTGVQSGDGQVTITFDPTNGNCPAPATPGASGAAVPIAAGPRFTG